MIRHPKLVSATFRFAKMLHELNGGSNENLVLPLSS